MLIFCLNEFNRFILNQVFTFRLWFFWLHERRGSYRSHGSHDNNGQYGRWRLHLFLINLFWRRRWRKHGQLSLCVYLHQDHQRQEDHYQKVLTSQIACDKILTVTLSCAHSSDMCCTVYVFSVIVHKSLFHLCGVISELNFRVAQFQTKQSC